MNSQLLAIGGVGYFLDDQDFKYHQDVIINEIRLWLHSDDSVLSIGQSIFKGLSGIAYRMSQDTLSEICCQFIDRHYSRWYMDMFSFIADRIDLRKMGVESAQSLIEHINGVLDNEQDRDLISCAPAFLLVLRNQNPELTDGIDRRVAEYFPHYYNSIYKLETTRSKKQDLPLFVRKYVDKIKKNNETQGENGVYFGHSTREIATVRAILLKNEIELESDTIDLLISAVADTLLVSKEGISTKLDAIELLICIAVKYHADYKRNQSVYERLFDQQDTLEMTSHSIISSNIDSISLKIGLQLLYVSMGRDVYSNILELMPYIKESLATTLAITRLFADYLETTDAVVFPPKVEAIILQNVLQWLHSEHSNIRRNATRILLTMSRNPENSGIVNRQLVNLIDSNSVYIKNLILRRLHKTPGITTETREYIISKCKYDANFVVRLVCEEIEKEHSGKE